MSFSNMLFFLRFFFELKNLETKKWKIVHMFRLDAGLEREFN